MLSDRVCLVSFNDELLCEGALDVREGHGAAKEAHVQAMILLAQLAETASAARTRRRDGNALSHAEVLDVGTQAIDHTRNLMAQSHRLLDANRAKTSVLVIVQIGAANATECDFDANLVNAQSG